MPDSPKDSASLAYEWAVTSLAEQRSATESFRNRSAAFISFITAALGLSLWSGDKMSPGAAWAVVAAFVLASVSTAMVQRPRRMVFGTDPSALLEALEQHSEDPLRRCIELVAAGWSHNRHALRAMSRWLLMETVFGLLAATIRFLDLAI